MVEAKALGKDLGAAKEKGFQYCWKNKVPYYVVTDGNVWELHDLREMGGKEIIKIQLIQMIAGEAARKLLALWRPAMPTVEIGPPLNCTTPTPPGLVSLNELERRMKSKEIPPYSKPPQRIVFPDGKEKKLRSWRDLLLAVVDWKKSQLSKHIPITWPGTGYILVSKENAHMRAPKPVGEYWVETHASAFYLVKTANYVLKVLGEDPARVHAVSP